MNGVDEAEKLLGYLGNSGKVLREISKKLETLPENFQILFVENSSNRLLVLKNLISELEEKGYTGLIVTLNLPVATIEEQLKNQGINPESLMFLDGITKHTKPDVTPKKNAIFLESLKDLVEISVSIEKAAEKLEVGKNFMIFDSLTTLLVYNEPKAVEKFTHNLIGKMRGKNIASVLFIAPNASKSIIDSVSEFCDTSIKID